MLYIDHELGGGANAYTKERVAEIVKAAMAIVVSYNVTQNVYHLTYYSEAQHGTVEAATLEEFTWVLAQVPMHEIVVSQVVSHPSPCTVLTWITAMIARTKARSTFWCTTFMRCVRVSIY